MVNSIVQVAVSQTVAPTPSTLQSTGALISQGATNLAEGNSALLTQLSDLTPLLNGALALSSITQSAGTATATTAATTISAGTYNSGTGLVTLTLTANIGIVPGSSVIVSGATGTGSFASIDGTFVAGVGSGSTTVTYTVAESLTMTITGGNVGIGLGITTADTFLTTIAGSTVVGYNGTFLATAASATTFTYPVPTATASPATGAPTYTGRNVAELLAMATTFFAQGSQQGVYVLELGAGEDAVAITNLGNYITANPNSNYTPGSLGYFYSYLVPRNWANDSSYLTLLAEYESTESQTYFFTTMTSGNYESFTALMKDVIGLVEAPGIPTTEFSLASAFWVSLHYAPSSTNKVTPFAFSFLSGVTPYPTKGNNPFLSALKTAGVNYIGTGAEGGITNTILLWGTTMDGRGFTYWYSVDAVQININVNISNAVINGSNNPANPLYLSQDGINRLQGVGAQTLNNLITYGLAAGTVVQTALSPNDLQTAINTGVFDGQLFINAVPFLTYYAQNPSDYKIGKYSGFSVGYITQNGFINILFNVNISDFITAP